MEKKERPYKERINPKTGKKEYKVRYYFMRGGKKRDSETAWFTSLSTAQKEAENLKREKEKEDEEQILQRRDKKLITAFEEYKAYLKELSDKCNTNTDVKDYTVARAIYNNHFPSDIQNVRIKDVTMNTFKKWIGYMDKKEGIGGGYIRLCRQCLIKFNSWMNVNGYYTDTEEYAEKIEISIRRAKIKNSLVNNKERTGKRKIISSTEILRIGRYFIDLEYGLGRFKNFYFYTLFYTLYFSGMRVEELTGLQWKFVDLRNDRRQIYIKSAISKIENVEHALERVNNGNHKTKNSVSIRTIPIFDFYYDLLIDYKESYKYQYGLKEGEMGECFVFPNIEKNNPHLFMNNDRTLYELKKTLKACGIENTDLQMFRHSCAMFLILTPPDGLGFTEEKVMDYFGHQDTEMLRSVYARLSEKEKADRMRSTFGDIYNPESTKDRTIEEKKKQELIDRLRGGNDKSKQIARKYRIHNQIRVAIKEGRTIYYYKKRDEEIIEEFMNNNNAEIKFSVEE